MNVHGKGFTFYIKRKGYNIFVVAFRLPKGLFLDVKYLHGVHFSPNGAFL